ncbi:MAG: ATP-binding protein [Clostridia bacterium]|nr:ATP-binding protein [Clostridia bacterium]
MPTSTNSIDESYVESTTSYEDAGERRHVDTAQFYSSTSKPDGLPLFEIIAYQNFKYALGCMVNAASYHKLLRIMGHPGSGKTRLLATYKEKNPVNTHYFKIPRACDTRTLLNQIGANVGLFFAKTAREATIKLELIEYLNGLEHQHIFLLDEADGLLSNRRRIENINALEDIRFIHDHAGMHATFIIAAPYELENRIKKSREDISNSQFYRRCDKCNLTGMPQEDALKYYAKISQDFHVAFDDDGLTLLTQKIAATAQGGLGAANQMLERCFVAKLPHWKEYYHQIELGTPRETALHVFENNDTVYLSRDIISNAMDN